MEGIFFPNKDELPCSVTDGGSTLRLLLSLPGLEIMTQNARRRSAIWLYPAADPLTVEYYLLLSGRMTIHLPGEPERVINAGEGFYVRGLTEDVPVTATEDGDLLCISSSQVFSELAVFNAEMVDLTTRINEKDNYTKHHSDNVMGYSVKLFKCFPERASMSIENMVLAARFHDVGKCRVPDEILKKTGRLTQDEYETMKLHPTFSAAFLRPRYGNTVADAVLFHHERLDGRGYPMGLRDDEIPFESKLIAVADSFDAMTTKRSYNNPKDPIAAAQELMSMPESYDADIAREMFRLVEGGHFSDIITRHDQPPIPE